MKKTMLVIAVLAMAAMIAAPAMGAQFYDTFDSYNDGNLNGQGGWMGNAGAEMSVVDDGVTLANDHIADTERTLTVQFDAIGGAGQTVYARAQVWNGNPDGTLGDGNIYGLCFNDSAGKNLARWYGAANNARGRVAGEGIVTATQPTLLTNQWNDLLAVINCDTKYTEFFLNGNSLGSLNMNQAGNAGVGNSVSRVQFQLSKNADNYGTIFFDNIYVGTTLNPVLTPEPSSFMALGMFGLGALGFIKRRR